MASNACQPLPLGSGLMQNNPLNTTSHARLPRRRLGRRVEATAVDALARIMSRTNSLCGCLCVVLDGQKLPECVA
eukprot:6270682-Amphidinium_carterae.1